MRTKAKHTLSPAEQLYVNLPADASTTEVALATVALWDEEDARKKGYSEKVADAQAAAERKKAKKDAAAKRKAAKQSKTARLPFALYASSYAMPRNMLTSALFPVGKGPRTHYADDIRILAAAGGVFKYRGPEIRQDDGGVLMALIAETCGRMLARAVIFNPLEMCKKLGRETTDGRYAVQHLRHCIQRLKSAVISVEYPQGFLEVSLIAKFAGDLHDEKWAVALDPEIVLLFQGTPTFIDIKKRALLKEGLQTALLGYFSAMYEDNTFSIEDLHKHSGSKASLRVFGRKLRSALPRLVAARVIAGFTATRGSVTIVRNQKPAVMMGA